MEQNETSKDIKDYYDKMNHLDQILSDILFYLHPEFLESELQKKINTNNLNEKKLSDYHRLITNVNFVFKKVMKYELYFSKFYPSAEKISKSEALEHHIHAYLEDLDILKNKVCCFLGRLKNDLKRGAYNKEEVEGALNHLIKNVLAVFKKVSENRNPHHHEGTKFLDSNLIDSNLAHIMLQDDNPLKSRFKPEFLENLKKSEIKSFEVAQANWISLAKKNNEQISGLVDEVFKRTNDFIYQFFEIKSIKELTR